MCGRRHRASYVHARGWHLSHSDRTHLISPLLPLYWLLFFLLLSLFENKPTPPYTYGLGKVFFSPKCTPRGRVGRRPPWTQIATDALPKQWASATIPPRAAPKFWAILAAPGRRHGRRPPLQTRPPFFSSARAFGPRENSHCEKCAEFGIFAIAWCVVERHRTHPSQLARLVGKRVGRRG